LQTGLSAALKRMNVRENKMLSKCFIRIWRMSKNIPIVRHNMLRNHVSFMMSHPTIRDGSKKLELNIAEDTLYKMIMTSGPNRNSPKASISFCVLPSGCQDVICVIKNQD
jgi:hypothetical protein